MAKKPSRPGRFKETRIINGIANSVIVDNGKIVEILGPKKSEEQKPKMVETSNDTEETPRIGLQLVSDDGSYVDPSRHDDETNNDTNKVYQEEKPKSNIPITSVSTEELSDIFKKDPTEPIKIPEPTKVTEQTKVSDSAEVSEQIKIFEPTKVTEQTKVPDPAEVSEQIKISEPVKIPESVPTTEQVKISEPTKIPEPTKVTKPVKIPEPTKASEPIKIPESVQASEPVKIPEPTKATKPVKSKENIPTTESIKSKENIPTTESIKAHEQVPIIKPQKPSQFSQVPKITIPKVQINIPPKNTTSEPIKLENISNKLGNILTNDTYPKSKETEVVGQNLQKANENVLSQQPVATKEKSTKEKRIFMSEELDAELLDERKFEQWMKKKNFNENLEKAMRFAEETKEQFEEKIPVLSGNIDNVASEVKNVETKLNTVDDRLGTVDKSIGTLCTGIDCVKEDVKKFQSSQEALEKLLQEKYQASHEDIEKLLQEKYQTSHKDLEESHNNLEKLVQDRFKELGEKVQSLERPTFTCENCGEQSIAPLSSFCPNCGSEIQSWSDEEGQPVKGWAPYWKRLGRTTSH